MNTKTITIVITEQIAEKVRAQQNEDAPNEMAFMLGGNLSKSDAHFRFLAKQVFLLNPSDYEVQHPGACLLTKEWWRNNLSYCAEQQMHIVNGHAHTFDTSGTPRESSLDLTAAEQMYPAVAAAFPGMATLSMVISSNFEGVEAHVFSSSMNCRIPVDKVIIYGRGAMKTLYPTSSPLRKQVTKNHSDYYSRLSLAFGEETVMNNRNFRVGAIGCGSLGELVIAQLANLGFKLTIGDMDEFCIENANRSMFGNQVTATRGIPKTEVCRRAVLQTNPDTDVRAVNGDLREEDVQRQFLDCDLLVITTDNETSRYVANHMAMVHGMALFDAATGIFIENKKLTGVRGQIIKVIPGSNLCHECSNFFDSTVAYQGLLSEEDYELARSRGYVDGDNMPAPSVMPLNMTTAGVTVWEMMRYISGSTPDDKWDILTFDLLKPGMQQHYYDRDSYGRRYDCALCSSDGMLLCGETAPLLTRQKGSTHEQSTKIAEALHG